MVEGAYGSEQNSSIISDLKDIKRLGKRLVNLARCRPSRRSAKWRSLKECRLLIEAGFEVVEARRFRVEWVWGMMRVMGGNRQNYAIATVTSLPDERLLRVLGTSEILCHGPIGLPL